METILRPDTYIVRHFLVDSRVATLVVSLLVCTLCNDDLAYREPSCRTPPKIAVPSPRGMM